ncbi:thioredoxin-disulfide reductase [bacterium]|jgi:thioredoxin-disulfide reductase|nr:thioredoxin-disulfide reductase [bacterium]
MYDIIIIGMGISGITAGIYAKRSNKKVLLIDKGMPGGLLNNIDKVSNYPGVPEITGPDFAEILEKQVEHLDIPYVLEEVKSLELNEETKKVITENNTYEAKRVILAMGRKPKYLGLDNEKSLLGKGLSTCAVCDAFFYKNENIAIVGTGNSALQEALYLANIVGHIYIINRRDDFRGEEILVENIKKNPKIEIIYNANIESMNEENNKLSSITLDNGTTLNVKGVFIYVGYRPVTDFIPKEILDENGYVKVNEKLETEINGVYAIGDIINKDTYQLVTAAADGARVITNMK